MKHLLSQALLAIFICVSGWPARAATEPGATDPEIPQSVKPPSVLTQAQRFLKIGDEYRARKELTQAIDYFSRAIQLDDTLDEAYFGRGMARGSSGLIAEGIRDLSVYIARHPDSSRAHTKRGIRYLWKGDSESAYKDFRKAIALDPSNAEAYDDLGVIYAQRRDYRLALESFRSVIRIEPLYFKAHHNMALVYTMLDEPESALAAVDKALHLKTDSRNSMRLKSVILQRLGRHKEAHEVGEEAEFMPDENWSEVAPLK